MELLKEKYLPLIREHWLPFTLGTLGVIFVGYGLIQSFVTKHDSSEITFQSSRQTTNFTNAIKPTPVKAKEVVVDIEGAVLRPGIHRLPAESRVQDVISEAGGLSEKADRKKLSQGMNLAARVTDGSKIYIPFEGETLTVQNGGGGNSILGVQTSGLVNINTASETELDSLSGVGPATAQKIISNRPYSSVEELVTKKAVGKSVFSKIKDKVTI